MKTSKNALLLSILTIFVVAFTACKKDDPEPVITSSGTTSSGSGVGTVMLHFHPMAGGNAFAFNTDYTDDFGNTYQFTRAEFYLSKIHFTDDDHNDIGVTNEYLLLNPNMHMYDIGDVNEGHAHELHLGIGVDSATNHLDPTTYDASHPLAPQNPAMHWGWSTGYRFLVLEGRVDTDGDNALDTDFFFHIGTDALYRTHAVEVHADVLEDQSNSIDLMVDWTKFLTGIDLSVDNSTHTANNLPLATTVADNMTSAIMLQ